MKIALLGIGTVGSGVAKVLANNKELFEQKVGQKIELTHIFGRSFRNIHDVDLSNVTLTKDIDEILNSDVDIVVELLGGVDFPYELAKKFLSKGIHFVTANKDMLALHVDELSALANENNVQLEYEAAVAGGIPVVQTINYSFNANNMDKIQGILNGTTNYILTRMSKEGLSFDEALQGASDAGYAESDPTNDVDGFDAQRKILLLSRIAYLQQFNLEEVAVKGIRDVKVKDIELGNDAGLTLKLIGQSNYNVETDSVRISVEPAFIANTHPLATIDHEKNSVFFNGDAVGEVMLYGPGAGSFETASAVVSDILNVIKLGFIGNTQPMKKATINSTLADQAYYIRFNEGSEKVFELLNQDSLQSEFTDDENNLTVVTSELSEAQVKELNEKLDVEAIYPIFTK